MSRTRKLDRYKLETVFDGDEVVHTSYESNLAVGLRKIEVTTRWKQKKDIGEGAFGIVWLEEEVGRRQLRAVKRLPQVFQKFDWSRELDTLAKLKDEKALFVQFLGWYENKDFVFLAMEYVEHGDLGHYLKKFGSEARIQAKEIVKQLLEGLMVLHERDICHRDLKPQNVLVASLSPIWVKIADFGVSKREKGTKLRTNCGTSGYFAPELLRLLPKNPVGNLYTNSVDIWCLGVIAHEILTSEIPFLDTTLHTISLSDSEMGMEPPVPVVYMGLLYEYSHGHRKFPVESLQNSRVSEKGVDFVMKLLAADPSSRITAKDALESPWLLDEIQEITVGSQIEPKTDFSRNPTPTTNASPALTSLVPKGYLNRNRRVAANPSAPQRLPEHDSILARQQPKALEQVSRKRKPEGLLPRDNDRLAFEWPRPDPSDITAMSFKPTDCARLNPPPAFTPPIFAEHPNRGPLHRISVSPKMGERLLGAGAAWGLIVCHPLYEQGLVDIGDISDRLKGLSRYDGQGPVFEENVILEAIQASSGQSRGQLLVESPELQYSLSWPFGETGHLANRGL